MQKTEGRLGRYGVTTLVGLTAAGAADALTNIQIENPFTGPVVIADDEAWRVRDSGHITATGTSTVSGPGAGTQAGELDLFGPRAERINNLGTFNNSGIVSLQTGHFTNTGTYNGLAGSETNGTEFNNYGALNLDGGSLGANHINWAGSTFDVASGDTGYIGRAEQTGVFNAGGIVTMEAGSVGTNAGQLNIRNLATLRVFGDNGSNGSGQFTNTVTGVIDLQEDYVNGSRVFGALNIQSDSVVNNGLIENNGGLFNIDPNFRDPPIGPQVTGSGDYIQNSGDSLIRGRLDQDEIRILGGVMNGDGTVNATSGAVYVGPNGTIGPGTSPGQLTIESDLDVDGTLYFEFFRNQSFFNGDDSLVVLGDVDFDSLTSEINLEFDFEPTANTTFIFLTAGSITGVPANIFIDGPFENGGEEEEEEEEEFLTEFSASNPPIWEETIGDYDFIFDIVDNGNGTESLQVTVVPEPNSLVALALGSFLLMRRRR